MRRSKEYPGTNTCVTEVIEGDSSRILPCFMEDLPIIGMNASLTGHIWGICETKEFDDAIRLVTRPPAFDIGLHYPHVPGGGELRILEFLFQDWECGSNIGEAPGPECPLLADLRRAEQLEPLIPNYNMPEGGGAFWVSNEHFVLLLRHIVAREFDVSALQRRTERPRPPIEYLPARLPRARGDVTEAHVNAFAATFPQLKPLLMALIPWRESGLLRSAPAKATKLHVQSLLGINVDLRNGFLASPAQIDETVRAVTYWASCVGCQEDLVSEVLDRRLPRVRLTVAGLPAGYLRNAAWSCAVDQILNTKKVWRPD
jgi:hypothetical protein